MRWGPKLGIFRLAGPIFFWGDDVAGKIAIFIKTKEVSGMGISPNERRIQMRESVNGFRFRRGGP